MKTWKKQIKSKKKRTTKTNKKRKRAAPLHARSDMITRSGRGWVLACYSQRALLLPGPINTRRSDCSKVGPEFVPFLCQKSYTHNSTKGEKEAGVQEVWKVRFHGSPLAPGLAIVVQARELFSSSSPKSLALGPAITVQIKGHVSSSENSSSWFGHRGTNQGAYFISPKFLPLVRPLRYRLRCMFNLSQNFAFDLAILVQTKEYVASIPKFCPWFVHRGTNQGACSQTFAFGSAIAVRVKEYAWFL